MRPPGHLDDLGDAGRAAWQRLVAATAARARERLAADGRAPTHALDGGGESADVRTVEWPAFPVRVAAEHGEQRAMALLDRRDPELGDVGRTTAQEEYAEWRVVRDAEGVARGVELTTELPDYWRVMAAHEPARTIELVAEFAGDPEVDPAAVYGEEIGDPLDPDVTPEARADAFARTMLPPRQDDPAPFSPYNDGREALCCMVHPSNNLDALIELLLSSARARLVVDELTGRPRFPSGSEAIAELDASAEDGRNSDPLLVERIVRFASDGLRIGLDDPAGLYIRALQRHELEQPDGEDVPASWVQLSRGVSAADATDGRGRAQRLRLALPPDADFSLADLVVRRTGEPLRFGGQLAELVELCAYLRTAPGGERA